MYEKILFFLEKNKNKNFNFIIEKYNKKLISILKQFSNINLIYVEDIPKVTFAQIILKGEDFLKMHYFSIGDLLYESFLSNQKKNLEEIDNTISLNNYSSKIFSFNISGEKTEIFNEEDCVELLDKNQIANLYKKNNSYKILLLSKILTSSFFFHEIIDFFPNKFLKNYFFKNLEEFKSLSTFLDLNVDLPNFDNFLDAVNFSIKYLNLTPSDWFPDFIDLRSNFFYEKIYDKLEVNCNNFFVRKIEINHKKPFIRSIEIKNDNYNFFSDDYFFYMFEILKLKKPNLNKILLEIYQKKTLDKKDIIFLRKNFITKSEIPNIKNLLLTASNYYKIPENLDDIYVYNIKTKKLEKHFIKKNLQDKIIINY